MSSSNAVIFRSVGAVFAGLVCVFIVSEGTDMALRSAGVFPSFDRPELYTAPLLLLATAYRTAAGVAGGYIAAALAPVAPMLHAVALGGVGLVLSTIGAIMMWDTGQNWYPLTLAVLAVPSAWAGGRLHRQLRFS